MSNGLFGFNKNHPVKRVKGFSLVEVMVGLTLGLLSTLVIMQVFTVFENQKRTTTSASDAQENGLMAIVQLEQDIRNAGAGFTNSSAFDCTTIYSQKNSVTPAPGMPTTVMAPVVITDGGAAGSDTIRVMSGTNFLGSIAATLRNPMPDTSAVLDISRITGFNDNDLILVTQGNNCTVMQVTAVLSSLKIQHNSGGNDSYNPNAAFLAANAWPTYTTGAKVLNLGSLNVNTYSVDANYNLQVTDQAAATSSLESSIVSVQAQYGISPAAGVQAVNAWVDATAASGFDALTSDEIKRIKAIRITVVARSNKKEGADVTDCTPGNANCLNGVNISALPDWKKYRYRVYTTIIPLRNTIWANV